MTFPVKITSATVKVQQASGGIITPSTGGDIEHYEFEFTTSTNSFPAAGNTVNMNFNVWYDLPNLKREALVTLALVFTDNVGATFSKSVDVSGRALAMLGNFTICLPSIDNFRPRRLVHEGEGQGGCDVFFTRERTGSGDGGARGWWR